MLWIFDGTSLVEGSLKITMIDLLQLILTWEVFFQTALFSRMLRRLKTDLSFE